MNQFTKKISRMRREFIKTPILVKIFRRGMMWYTVQVSKGPTMIKKGEDHTIHNIHDARKIAESLVEELKTRNSNFVVTWKEFIY